MITDTDANITEACFHNGERHMKEKVIKVLVRYKGLFPCESETVDCILNMLQGL